MTPDLRAKVISEWRGYREKAQSQDRAQAVGTTLEGVMQKLGLHERLTEGQINAAWTEIVGEWFGLHTHPDRLRGGVLYVRVIQSSIQFELDRSWKPQIIKKLRERFGAKRIRDVQFRVG